MKNNKKVIINIIICFIIILVLFFCIQRKTKPNIIIYKQQPQEVIINEGVLIDTNTYIIPINQDSIDRVQFIKDSIEFARVCKAINGGYNGYKERYNNWLRARNVLKNKK